MTRLFDQSVIPHLLHALGHSLIENVLFHVETELPGGIYIRGLWHRSGKGLSREFDNLQRSNNSAVIICFDRRRGLRIFYAQLLPKDLKALSFSAQAAFLV